MTQLDLLRQTVKEILLNDWDPIGVRNVVQAQNEYDQYIGAVARMLVAGQPASALSNYLLQVETESMGLKGDHDRAELVAAKLQRVV